jgi:BASS family bile acid:Na+ symporter
MDLAHLVPLVLQASIALIVISLGLEASLEDAVYLFRRPAQLARSLLAMNVVMPLFAAAVAAAFALHPAVEIALLALAVSPVPPILPKKEVKAGGRASRAMGVLVAAALLAIVFVPLGWGLLGWAFSLPIQVPLANVARIVVLSVLAPLAIGMAVRRVVPAFAERIATPVSLVGTVLLVAGALVVLVSAWPAIVSLIGNGTILAIAAFTLIGLVVGHLLGGADPEDRTVLALSSASRHPGVAMAIATANVPGQKLVGAAVVLYLLLSAVVSIPYLIWSRHQSAATTGTARA